MDWILLEEVVDKKWTLKKDTKGSLVEYNIQLGIYHLVHILVYFIISYYYIVKTML